MSCNSGFFGIGIGRIPQCLRCGNCCNDDDSCGRCDNDRCGRRDNDRCGR